MCFHCSSHFFEKIEDHFFKLLHYIILFEGSSRYIFRANKKTALRSGDWAMIPPYNGNAYNKQVKIELGVSKEYQLFNLKEDRGQQNNLAESNKEKLDELVAIYQGIRGTEKVEIKELELK